MSLQPWITADDAITLLGVKRATLYAYVSRGLVRSVPVAGTRERRYARGDLERLKARRRARSGHGPCAAEALHWGQPVLDSAVTEIGPGGPCYRGRPAVELARGGSSFEQTAALLWRADATALTWHAEGLGRSFRQLRQLLRRDAQPFDTMLLTLAVQSVSGNSAQMCDAGGPLLHAGTMIRQLAAAPALLANADRLANALARRCCAATLMEALGVRYTRRACDAVEQALILCADHELNASSFAARVAASTGAELSACLLAGLATLSGPNHGRASERVEALLHEVDRPERAATVVRERLRRGDARVSILRTSLRSRVASATSRLSPMAWPWVSLTYLKSSRSMSSNATW